MSILGEYFNLWRGVLAALGCVLPPPPPPEVGGSIRLYYCILLSLVNFLCVRKIEFEIYLQRKTILSFFYHFSKVTLTSLFIFLYVAIYFFRNKFFKKGLMVGGIRTGDPAIQNLDCF